jgi:hypothetical protein
VCFCAGVPAPQRAGAAVVCHPTLAGGLTTEYMTAAQGLCSKAQAAVMRSGVLHCGKGLHSTWRRCVCFWGLSLATFCHTSLRQACKSRCRLCSAAAAAAAAVWEPSRPGRAGICLPPCRRPAVAGAWLCSCCHGCWGVLPASGGHTTLLFIPVGFCRLLGHAGVQLQDV